MRNLKKLFAVVIAVAMMLTAMAPAFAAETAAKADTAAKLAEQIGMLKGDGGAVDAKYLSTVPSRLQALIMFLRLKGLEDDAVKFAGKDNFADAEDVEWAEGKNILAYAKANGDKLGIKGIGDNKYDPNGKMTADAYYKVMLESLGYVQGTDFEWEGVLKFAETKGLKIVAASKTFTIDNLATATIEALKATVKGDDKTTLAAKLEKEKAISAANAKAITEFEFPVNTDGVVALKEVTVKSANAIAVRFVSPLANTKNITATVKRGPLDETLTAAWDKDNKELTLSKDTRLVTGDYTVEVKDGSKDLGTKTVTVEQEKLAKIDITSDQLIRYIDKLDTAEATKYKGEFNYKAYNQYGDDVTGTALAANLQWFFNITNNGMTDKNGKVTITSEYFSITNHFYFKELTATANLNESNNFVTASKTLKISENFGAIDSIDLKSIANPDGAVLKTAAPETFYIDYDIKDADGNAITSYNILNNSVDLRASTDTAISSVTWEQDVNDSTKGVIAVKLNTADTNVNFDQIVSITAMSTNSGKSDILQFDLKKPQQLTKFQLLPPSIDVAAGEKVEFAYLAYDQDNAAMTSDVNKSVKVSSTSGKNGEAVNPEKQTIAGVDKIYITFPTEGSYTLTSSVDNTGNFSQLTISVRNTALPTYLREVKNDVVLPGIVAGGTIKADFDSNKAFRVLDQYDRDFDLFSNYVVGGYEYYIEAESSNKNYVVVDEANKIANSNKSIILKGTNADTSGSANIKFTLKKKNVNNPYDVKDVEYKTVSIMKVKKDDISSYEFANAAELANMYATDRKANDSAAMFTERNMEYFPEIKIVGLTSSKLKVAIDKNDVLDYGLSNSADFGVRKNVDGVTDYVYSDNDDADAQVEGLLTAIIKQGSSDTKTIQTALKGFYAAPAAKSIEVGFTPNTVIRKSGDTYIVKVEKLRNQKLYSFEENADGGAATGSNFFFEIEDQYGAKVIKPQMILMNNDIMPTMTFANDLAAGTFSLTVVTDNGIMKTITVVAE